MTWIKCREKLVLFSKDNDNYEELDKDIYKNELNV